MSSASSFVLASNASIRGAPAASVWAWRVVEVGVATTGSGVKAASPMPVSFVSSDADLTGSPSVPSEFS